MADTLKDLLANKNFAEPPEIQIIKDFVQANTKLTPRVSIAHGSYVIYVSSAAAAGVLRTKIVQLQKKLDTEARIQIRIG